jgi:hypothetical protein
LITANIVFFLVFDPALRRLATVGAGFFAVSGYRECAPPKQRTAHAKHLSFAEAPWLRQVAGVVKMRAT